nr:ABC transporter permease [Chloroflexota bacterium]
MNLVSRFRKFSFWSWVWFILGALYFLIPLYATLRHSLRMERDVIGFRAYERAFADPSFLETFLLSNLLAVATIIA